MCYENINERSAGSYRKNNVRGQKHHCKRSQCEKTRVYGDYLARDSEWISRLLTRLRWSMRQGILHRRPEMISNEDEHENASGLLRQ